MYEYAACGACLVPATVPDMVNSIIQTKGCKAKLTELGLQPPLRTSTGGSCSWLVTQPRIYISFTFCCCTCYDSRLPILHPLFHKVDYEYELLLYPVSGTWYCCCCCMIDDTLWYKFVVIRTPVQHTKKTAQNKHVQPMLLYASCSNLNDLPRNGLNAPRVAQQ